MLLQWTPPGERVRDVRLEPGDAIEGGNIQCFSRTFNVDTKYHEDY